MKIGFMTLWNAANGPSIHAELIGRELVNMGYEIKVFSAIEHPDARPTNQVDEDYVIRHFSVDRVIPITRAYYFDPNPLIDEDYDIFIAENVERLPTLELYELYPIIKDKAKTIMVVHEGAPSKDPLYYLFDWDAIVCFDERYVEYIGRYFPREKIHIIPYPCHPYKPGDKDKARDRLNLPKEYKIIMSYGFRPGDLIKILPAIAEVNKVYSLKYLIFVNPGSEDREIIKLRDRYDFIEVNIMALPLDLLYEYLYASDALIFYRESSKYRGVLSSSVCLTLGSGCPILFSECNFVEKHGEEIIKYRDPNDLKDKLIKLFNEGFDDTPVKKFLEKRNARAIAEEYLKLFKKLV